MLYYRCPCCGLSATEVEKDEEGEICLKCKLPLGEFFYRKENAPYCICDTTFPVGYYFTNLVANGYLEIVKESLREMVIDTIVTNEMNITSYIEKIVKVNSR